MDSSVIIVVLLVALVISISVSVKALIRQKNSSDLDSEASKEEVTSMLERLTSDLKVQMGELANKALQDNNEQFLTLASERMNVVKEQTKGLLDPFEKQIEQLGKTVSELRSAHDKEKGVVETIASRLSLIHN